MEEQNTNKKKLGERIIDKAVSRWAKDIEKDIERYAKELEKERAEKAAQEALEKAQKAAEEQKVIEENAAKEMKGTIKYKTVSLDNKLKEYYNWCAKNMISSDCDKKHRIDKEKKFIEKVATWYELRYPNYEVNRLMPCIGQEYTKIDDVMFKNNAYVTDLLGDNTDAKELEWADFYNSHAFIKSLPGEEQHKFDRPAYTTYPLYLIGNKDLFSGEANYDTYIYFPHIHLANTGRITEAESITIFTNGVIKDEELVGLHVTDAIKLFNERGIKLPAHNEIEPAINKYNRQVEYKERMLDAIMYKIIQNGGKRIGPRRAFLFAKEFGRNIDVPMQYGIDTTDKNLRLFIYDYLKMGGDINLVCYEMNESLWIKNKIIVTPVTLTETLATEPACKILDKDLYQRLVNALSLGVDPQVVEEEKLKEEKEYKKDIVQKRIERHIERSKKN